MDDADFIQNIIRHKKTSPETLHVLATKGAEQFSGNTLFRIASQTKTLPKTLHELAKNRRAMISSPHLRDAIVQHHYVSSETLDFIHSNHTSQWVSSEILSHRNASSSTIEKIMKSTYSNDYFRGNAQAAIRHKNTNRATLEHIMNEPIVSDDIKRDAENRLRYGHTYE